MSEHDVRPLTVDAFLARLGSEAPTPGGGTGAAVAGAMGASLVRMLAVLTLGRPRYAEHAALMEAVSEEAGHARDRLLRLAAEDAAAYDRVSAALRLPRGSDEEKTAREAAVQSALKGATEVPLRVMEACVEVIGLAKNAVRVGNRNALSDGAAGAELCRAALKVASYNVRTNLDTITDEPYRKLQRTRMDEMLYMGTLVATEIDSQVSESWK